MIGAIGWWVVSSGDCWMFFGMFFEGLECFCVVVLGPSFLSQKQAASSRKMMTCQSCYLLLSLYAGLLCFATSFCCFELLKMLLAILKKPLLWSVSVFVWTCLSGWWVVELLGISKATACQNARCRLKWCLDLLAKQSKFKTNIELKFSNIHGSLWYISGGQWRQARHESLV